MTTLKPHMCIVKHDPPYSYGDCLRACVATLLSVEAITDVPHFLINGDDEQATAELRNFLASRGYRPFFMALRLETPEALFEMMAGVNSDIPYILFHKSGGGDHVVVCRNDKVIHNPAWVKSGIDGPSSNGFFAVMVLVPITP